MNEKRILKTLEEHNAEASKCYNQMQQRPNGIECPECKSELWDTDPMLTLTSIPPQKNVHCRKCGYRGVRIA